MNFNSMDMFFTAPQEPHKVLRYNNTNNTNNTDEEIDESVNKIPEYEITKHLYQNTRGVNTPNAFILHLDSKSVSGGTANNFVYNKVIFELCDPIIIDSPTEIYLEYLHFQNVDVSDSSGSEAAAHLEVSSQFYLYIDEFAIKNI